MYEKQRVNQDNVEIDNVLPKNKLTSDQRATVEKIKYGTQQEIQDENQKMKAAQDPRPKHDFHELIARNEKFK